MFRPYSVITAVLLSASLLNAQKDAPEKGLPSTFHCGDRDDLPMSHKDLGLRPPEKVLK